MGVVLGSSDVVSNETAAVVTWSDDAETASVLVGANAWAVGASSSPLPTAGP